MTKNDEITLLRETAERLGRKSYCGPWLASILSEIERDMASDLFPMLSYAESRRQADEMRTVAHREAARIVGAAAKEADRIREEARASASATRERLRVQVRAVLEALK